MKCDICHKEFGNTDKETLIQIGDDGIIRCIDCAWDGQSVPAVSEDGDETMILKGSIHNCFECPDMNVATDGMTAICMRTNAGYIDKKKIDDADTIPEWCDRLAQESEQ